MISNHKTEFLERRSLFSCIWWRLCHLRSLYFTKYGCEKTQTLQISQLHNAGVYKARRQTTLQARHLSIKTTVHSPELKGTLEEKRGYHIDFSFKTLLAYPPQGEIDDWSLAEKVMVSHDVLNFAPWRQRERRKAWRHVIHWNFGSLGTEKATFPSPMRHSCYQWTCAYIACNDAIFYSNSSISKVVAPLSFNFYATHIPRRALVGRACVVETPEV